MSPASLSFLSPTLLRSLLPPIVGLDFEQFEEQRQNGLCNGVSKLLMPRALFEDSQSSNPGSIPGSATKPLPLSRVLSCTSADTARSPQQRRTTSCGTVPAEMGHNLGHSTRCWESIFFNFRLIVRGTRGENPRVYSAWGFCNS